MNESSIATLDAVGGPVMSIDAAVEAASKIQEFVKKLMKPGEDFGKIPGTGEDSKPTLHQPGAEKLCWFFGLRKDFQELKAEEDWTGEAHDGEPFFRYVYRCNLYRGDVLVACYDGESNSWEKKYRWREEKRKCPACGKATIIKGKAEYGGGWLCWKKKDGCGATFADNAPEITEQVVGLVPNPDVFDAVNTIRKIAMKRAFVSAAKLATNASQFFTVDLEEVEHEPKPAPPTGPSTLDKIIEAFGAAKTIDRLNVLYDAAYQRGLSSDDLEAVEDAYQDNLQRLGYEPATAPAGSDEPPF